MKDLFTKRNQYYSKINKIVDYIGKSIRENTTVYKIDESNGHLFILTESDHIIEGSVVIGDNKLSLNKLKVYPVDKYLSDEKFDDLIGKEATQLISNLNESNYGVVEDSFGKILDIFSDKINIRKHRSLLERKKRSIYNRSVVDSEVWTKCQEVKKGLVKFLKENLKTVMDNEDLYNSIVLSRAVSTAIDVPTITLESLAKRKRFSIPDNFNNSIYSLICQKELIQRELLEAKNTFSNIWTSSESMRKLALAFNSDDATLNTLIGEAVTDLPLFALSTKQQITDIVDKIHRVYNQAVRISEAKRSEFVSKIYKAKKPYREKIINILSESYGINITNLRYRPSFEDLSKANSTALEILSKIAKKPAPALSDVLGEASESLRTKAGFSALFFSDFLNEAFTKAGILNEMPTDMGMGGPRELDLEKIKLELMKIRDAIAMSDQGQTGGEAAPEEGMEEGIPEEGMEEGVPEEEGMAPEEEGMGEVAPEEGMGEEIPEEGMGEEVPEEGMPEDGMGEEMPGAGTDIKDEVASLAQEIEELLSDTEEDYAPEELETEEGEDLPNRPSKFDEEEDM